MNEIILHCRQEKILFLSFFAAIRIISYANLTIINRVGVLLVTHSSAKMLRSPL